MTISTRREQMGMAWPKTRHALYDCCSSTQRFHAKYPKRSLILPCFADPEKRHSTWSPRRSPLRHYSRLRRSLHSRLKRLALFPSRPEGQAETVSRPMSLQRRGLPLINNLQHPKVYPRTWTLQSLTPAILGNFSHRTMIWAARYV